MISSRRFWIGALLLIGGYALDQVLARGIVQNSISSSNMSERNDRRVREIWAGGRGALFEAPADQRFREPYSGVYFQISGAGQETFPSRSLWDRRLKVDYGHKDVELHKRDSFEFAGRAAAHPGTRRYPAGATFAGGSRSPSRAGDRRPDQGASIAP
jgi:hypothetical protein